MHPQLVLHKHPGCADIIKQFKRCHDEHPVAKFFGECNVLKYQLDACFRQEKEVKRAANLEASRRSQERLRARRAQAAVSAAGQTVAEA